MRLDLEELENKPTDKLPGFKERIENLIPSLYTHHCSPGYEGGFFERIEDGTWMGTVGCVALDSNGELAAATSTGGKGFEVPFRVSDSATIAGNYANEKPGVSCTGVGEDIVRGAIAAKIVTRVTDGFSLEEANIKTFGELKSFGGFAGAISIDSHGNIFHIDSDPYMVWGLYDKGVRVFN